MGPPIKYEPRILIWDPSFKEGMTGYLHVWVGIRCFEYSYVPSTLYDFVRWGHKIIEKNHPGKFRSYADCNSRVREMLEDILGHRIEPVPRDWIVK